MSYIHISFKVLLSDEVVNRIIIMKTVKINLAIENENFIFCYK